MGKEDLLEWVSATVTQATINTFTVTEIDTPNSPQANLAMHIKKVIFDVDEPDWVDDTLTKIEVALIKGREPTSMQDYGSDATIAWFEHSIKVDITATTAMVHARDKGTPLLDFGEDSVLFAGQSLYVAVMSTAMTNGKNAKVRVFYKLKKIPSKDFLDAITEDFT